MNRMLHHTELVQREKRIFAAHDDQRITTSDMLRQLLDLWHHYQEQLKKEAIC